MVGPFTYMNVPLHRRVEWFINMPQLNNFKKKINLHHKRIC